MISPKFKAQSSTIAVILILLLIASCGGGEKKQAPAQKIEATKVTKGTIERPVLFTGNIVAKDAANVFSRANGRVSKKLLKEGDPVKKGEGILVVDRDEIGYSFKPMLIDSPIDGYVGSIFVDVGSIVYDRTVFAQQPAAIVVRPGVMRVKLDIPERYLGAILPGTEVTMIVDSLGGEAFKGSIVTSSPVVDEKTRTANVEAEFSNTDGRLRHGMFGRLNLVVEKRQDTLTVPNGAISWEGEKRFVYKVEADVVRRIEVKLGMRNDVHVEVLDGVAENDLVAVGNLIDLSDGEKITITNEIVREE